MRIFSSFNDKVSIYNFNFPFFWLIALIISYDNGFAKRFFELFCSVERFDFTSSSYALERGCFLLSVSWQIHYRMKEEGSSGHLLPPVQPHQSGNLFLYGLIISHRELFVKHYFAKQAKNFFSNRFASLRFSG